MKIYPYLCSKKLRYKQNTNKMQTQKLQTVTFTMQEIWAQTTPKIERNKKKYSRKNKHKNKKWD